MARFPTALEDAWYSHSPKVPEFLREELGVEFCRISYLVKRLTGEGAESWTEYDNLISSLAQIGEVSRVDIRNSWVPFFREIIEHATRQERIAASVWRKWAGLPQDVVLKILAYDHCGDCFSPDLVGA